MTFGQAPSDLSALTFVAIRRIVLTLFSSTVLGILILVCPLGCYHKGDFEIDGLGFRFWFPLLYVPLAMLPGYFLLAVSPFEPLKETQNELLEGGASV